MTGTVLDWALTGEMVASVQTAVDYVEQLTWEADRSTQLEGIADAAVVERLRALGYLESSESPGEPATQPAESARSLLNLGTVLLEQDRPEEALDAYQRALELDPASPGAWLKCAVAQHRLGLFEEALASNRKVLELGGSPAHRESASLGMAIALVELGKPAEAILLLEAATAHMPGSFILWKTMGDVALGEGQLGNARHAYENTVAIREDVDSMNRLAALVLQLDNDSERAEELWRNSLRIDPDQPRVKDALRAIGAEVP
jgi:tetratricopeptide (TPR) repeat protein